MTIIVSVELSVGTCVFVFVSLQPGNNCSSSSKVIR